MIILVEYESMQIIIWKSFNYQLPPLISRDASATCRRCRQVPEHRSLASALSALADRLSGFLTTTQLESPGGYVSIMGSFTNCESGPCGFYAVTVLQFVGADFFSPKNDDTWRGTPCESFCKQRLRTADHLHTFYHRVLFLLTQPFHLHVSLPFYIYSLL